MSSDWLSPRLIDSLGLIPMRLKGGTAEQPQTTPTPSAAEVTEPAVKAAPTTRTEQPPQLDKHEFRLLVNMLKAIGHECQYDHIRYDGHEVRYQLDQLTLVFNDLHATDDDEHLNLASLADIIKNPQLKRPVWEKLKTIQAK
jgi:hypothetical protein